ncbi:hypothetical protein EDB19DRAFT_1833195 [Suillus lakei]|nr:hypothetical protein EDB19DRAFT_1833195 [Suillus lakei]
MTKTKNNTVPDCEGNSDAQPSKKMRLSNTGDGEHDTQTSKDDNGIRIKVWQMSEYHSDPEDHTLILDSMDDMALLHEADTAPSTTMTTNQLHKLLEYTNTNANIYVLGKLLLTATCGQYKPINDHSKILCNPATGEPLTIWVVSKIMKQSGVLMAKMSNPVLSINQQTTQVIHAIKWQNAKNSDAGAEAMLFDAVYDARLEGSLKTYNEDPVKLSETQPSA